MQLFLLQIRQHFSLNSQFFRWKAVETCSLNGPIKKGRHNDGYSTFSIELYNFPKSSVIKSHLNGCSECVVEWHSLQQTKHLLAVAVVAVAVIILHATTRMNKITNLSFAVLYCIHSSKCMSNWPLSLSIYLSILKRQQMNAFVSLYESTIAVQIDEPFLFFAWTSDE